MVKILFRRRFRIFQSITFLLVVAAGDGGKIDGYQRGEKLAMRMKIESLENATRYRWIERSMREHLQNDPEADSSFIHVLIHPKANPRIAEAVLKASTEFKSAVISSDEKNVCRNCNFNETCSKITRIIGIYDEVEDINPRDWKNSYGIAWNPRSKIAIWLSHSSIHEDSTDNVKYENILETFWSLNAINVVLLTAPMCEKNCSDTWKPRVYSYDPFVPKFGRPGKRGKLLERTFDDELFHDKLRNLHGYPMRVSMYQEEPSAVLINYTQPGSGIEVNNLRYISNWLNFTVELISSPITLTSYTIQLPDGEVVGPIGDILKNRSVLLANSEYVENTLDKRVEFVQPFARAEVKFLVPAAGLMPGIFRIFRSIEYLVALLIFVNSLFLMSYFMIRKTRYSLFVTWRLLMHQQIERISDDTAERIFLIFWIIWAFILGVAIQSQLIKDLTSPPFYKSIDTLKELAASPLTLMFEQVDIDSLMNSDSELKNNLGERAIGESNFARCADILLRHMNVSCSIDSVYIRDTVKNLERRKRKKATIIDHSHRRRRREFVHIAKEVLTEYWRTIVVQEGFPYLNKFNVGFHKLIEFGLMVKWWGESSRQHFEINPPVTTHPKLNLNHFEGTFKILVFGNCAAFVIFLAEIILYRAKRLLKNGLWRPTR